MKAQKFKKNNFVGVCAPSGVVTSKNKIDLEISEQLLKEYNLNVKYSKNIFANTLGYSATVGEKVNDINELINDSNIKAIIFAKGGNNCNSILDYIDYEQIKKNNKFFIGFSDNTILLNAIYKKTGLITYHFTNFKGFCSGNIEFNKSQFKQVFFNGYQGEVCHNSNWITIRKGVAKGKLIGGNLGSFVKLLNTPYCPNFRNKILFIEELGIESSPEEVSSNLYQLKNTNVFEQISGILIGNYDNDKNIKLEDIVLDVVKNYDFPIIKCNDFGHTSSNIVIPIGLKCKLDADNCKLIFEESSAK